MYARVLLIIFCGQFSFPLNSIRSIIFTLGPLSPRGRHINTSTSTWPKYTISPTHCDIPLHALSYLDRISMCRKMNSVALAIAFFLVHCSEDCCVWVSLWAKCVQVYCLTVFVNINNISAHVSTVWFQFSK